MVARLVKVVAGHSGDVVTGPNKRRGRTRACTASWCRVRRLAPHVIASSGVGRSSGVRGAGPAVEAAMTKSSARLGVMDAHVPRGPGATAVVEGSSPAYKKPLCSSVVLRRVHF